MYLIDYLWCVVQWYFDCFVVISLECNLMFFVLVEIVFDCVVVFDCIDLLL